MGRERLDAYLNQAGAQIRWRRARKSLLQELGHHVADQELAYRAEGAPEDEALDRAVAEMGDPVEVFLRGYTLSLRLEDAAKVEVELA